MAGSHVAVIVMPIVIAVCLAFWISLVYWASFHPQWKHHARPPRTDVAGGVFEATHSGRQLQPLWGEPVSAIPPPRGAASAETYAGAQAGAAEAGAAEAGGAGAPPADRENVHRLRRVRQARRAALPAALLPLVPGRRGNPGRLGAAGRANRSAAAAARAIGASAPGSRVPAGPNLGPRGTREDWGRSPAPRPAGSRVPVGLNLRPRGTRDG
jgi:hypothetical protein